MSDLGDRLSLEFGPARVGREVPLAPFTTFRVGGPAELFVEARTSDEIVTALRFASAANVMVTLLGGGSITSISPSRVRADAAVTINGLVRWTITHGAAGLEAWAGTPGTVGGAVFGNAHFGGRLIGDLITDVRIAGRDGSVTEHPASAMAFGYDRSRLQDTGEVLLTATFRVEPGEPAALRRTARESLAYRKRTQPLDSPSAGCIFQNPQRERDAVPEGIPWSAGALIDRAGLKGAAVGSARVSATHGNFIVTDGHASAREIRRLIERCRRAVRDRFGVGLREEIVYLGEFDVDTVD